MSNTFIRRNGKKFKTNELTLAPCNTSLIEKKNETHKLTHTHNIFVYKNGSTMFRH